MKSLVRLLVENRIQLRLADEPTICGDDILKHDDVIGGILINHADSETVDLMLEVIREMAAESQGGEDPSRSYAFEELPVDMRLALSEDDLEFYDPEDPGDNPTLRPKLENPLELLVEILVEDILYYSFSETEPDFAREQLARISHQLRQESPETIQMFLSVSRKKAELIKDRKRFHEQWNLLVSMPYDLGLVPDPR